MRPDRDLTGRYVRTNEGTGLVISCKRSGTLLVQLPGDRVREFSRTQVAVVDPPEPPRRKCIHCGCDVQPGTAYPNVCGSCQELLADMEEDDEDDAPPPASAPPPAPVRPPAPRSGRFEPSPDDVAAYRELVAAGAFEPPATRKPPRPFSYGPHNRRR
jgi:hypothetical protein